MTTWQEAIAAYTTIARADGKSEKTITWVRDSARYLCAFLGEETELADITQHDIRRWVVALRDRPRFADHPYTPASTKLSPTTVNAYVRGVRLLFSTLVSEEIIDEHPVAHYKAPKIAKKTIQPLTENQLKAIFHELDRTGNPLRNRAMVGLMLDSCLRLSEVGGLLLENTNLESGEVKVMGKGSKERVVPLSAWSTKQLLFYQLKERPSLSPAEFFVGGDGRPVSTHSLQLVLRRIGKRLGLRCNAHTFRHTGALLLVRNGLDPFRLQKILGHADLTMTRRYVQLGDGDLKESHRKLNFTDRLKL